MRKLDNLISGKATYVLAGVTLLGAALRLYHLNYQSLWLDELHSIIPTDPNNSLLSIIEYSKTDQPPLFFIYIHYAFTLFGYNELVGRMASAFLGLLGIIGIYFLGKECEGKAVGLFAALLTAVSYYHIYYSQELRFYSMSFLFSVLSYLFFIRAFKRNKLIDFTGYGIFTICLLYTHYYGLIIFCTQILTFFILLTYKRDLRFIMASIISGIVIMVCFSPWIPIIIHDSGIETFWVTRPGPFFVAVYFYDYTGKDAFTTILFLFFLFLFVQSFRNKTLIKPETRAIYLILILWMAFSYLLPYIRSITSTPMLHDRYTIVTLPAWILMFAIGWHTITSYKWKYTLSLTLVLSAMINLAFVKQHYTRLQKDQFREAAEIAKSTNQFHYPIYSGLSWYFNFYFRNTPEKVIDLNVADLSHVEYFWLLQAHHSPEEMDTEISKLRETFDVVEIHSQYEANAVLLKRK
jgi:mannosyltransferase